MVAATVVMTANAVGSQQSRRPQSAFGANSGRRFIVVLADIRRTTRSSVRADNKIGRRPIDSNRTSQ